MCVCWPAAWSISCPAFSVHLSAWCILHVLPCLYCSSVGLLQIYSISCSAISTYLSAWCMLHLLPFLSIWRHAAWSLLPCLYCPSVSLLHDLLPALPGIETNAQMFRYRSLGSKRNQNVLVCSKIFFSKKERFYLFQKNFNETKTFCCVPEFFTGTLLRIPRT